MRENRETPLKEPWPFFFPSSLPLLPLLPFHPCILLLLFSGFLSFGVEKTETAVTLSAPDAAVGFLCHFPHIYLYINIYIYIYNYLNALISISCKYVSVWVTSAEPMTHVSALSGGPWLGNGGCDYSAADESLERDAILRMRRCNRSHISSHSPPSHLPLKLPPPGPGLAPDWPLFGP